MAKRVILTLILAMLTLPSGAQGIRIYENTISRDLQKEILSFLADDLCGGRECGERGGCESADFILDRFHEWGLQPLNWHMVQSFPHNDSTVARNIYAMVPAVVPTDRYVIVSAHYDHIGTIRHSIYNGADDNASGVTAMLSLAKAFSEMRRGQYGPDKNILFVAFDGHEKGMCGSKWFGGHLADLGISARQIDCVVNIDIIGTNLEPVGKNPEYIIFLGENTLPGKYHGLIQTYATFPSYSMDVDLTFYGSRNFTEYVYSSGDQSVFRKMGIPAVMFTSGFHKYTLKTTDDPEIIDFDLLRKRTLLIFNFTYSLCRQ